MKLVIDPLEFAYYEIDPSQRKMMPINKSF